MRDFAELNMNGGGKSVGRPAPTEELVREFEINFAIKLPEEYLVISNTLMVEGGVDTISPSIGATSVFGRLIGSTISTDKESSENLWHETTHWRPVLGEKAVPFAEKAR